MIKLLDMLEREKTLFKSIYDHVVLTLQLDDDLTVLIITYSLVTGQSHFSQKVLRL